MNKRKLTLSSGFQRYRFAILLAALLGMLVHGPLLEIVMPGLPPIAHSLMLGIVFAWLTISAVNVVSETRHATRVAVCLGVLLLVAQLADLSLQRIDTHALSTGIALLFMGHVIFVLLRFILNEDRVDAEMVFASLCIYLLLGVLWALAYSLLEVHQNNAFAYTQAAETHMRFGTRGTSIALYFSFVTMTTLGYGDITPVTAPARALVTLQAVCGQLYLTVLVAWLVGSYVTHSYSQSAEDHSSNTDA